MGRFERCAKGTVFVKTNHFTYNNIIKIIFQAQDQFVTPLQDQTVKEGKDKKVEFVAKFTKQNAKVKWLFRKNVRIY